MMITCQPQILTANNPYFACNRCHKLNTSFGRSSITGAIGQTCPRGCQNLECPKPESKKEFLFSKALQSWVYPQSLLPSSIISALLSSTARGGNHSTWVTPLSFLLWRQFHRVIYSLALQKMIFFSKGIKSGKIRFRIFTTCFGRTWWIYSMVPSYTTNSYYFMFHYVCMPIATEGRAMFFM